MTSVQVDRAQSNAMNLQVLKRKDDAVMEIVDTASHVVMYEFDQDTQSWKRKDVEGCLFVVKRFTAPRFQIFVNNRLSTTNMTLPIEDKLEVDSVDTFLILRSPDPSYASGYAIYGVWFFPEEDREKILKLLHRIITSLKEPQAQPVSAPAANGVPPKAKSKSSKPPKQQQQQQQQTSTEQQPQSTTQQPRGRSRSRNNKRDDSNKRGGGAAAGPKAILQRSPKTGKNSPQQEQSTTLTAGTTTTTTAGTGMIPISKADGIAAGEAILGMISQNQPRSTAPPTASKQQTQVQQQPVAEATAGAPLLVPNAVMGSTSSPSSSAAPTSVSKEQLKQTLIALLDDSQFFDQIYHAYVDRVHKRS